jgi:hypothetical protein
MADKPESVDKYIRERMLDGVRDPETLADELTKPHLRGLTAAQQLELLRPVVRAYAENRVRGWQRAVEDANGRRKQPSSKDAAVASVVAAGVSKGLSKGATEARHDAAAPRDFGPPMEHLTPLEKREMFLRESTYVPGIGAVWNADLTPDHIKAAIAGLKRTRAGVDRSIQFLERMLAVMEKHHAKQFRDVPLDESLDDED